LADDESVIRPRTCIGTAVVALVLLSVSAAPAITSASGAVPTAEAGSTRATTAIWSPAPGTTWQWQIVGRVRPPYRPVAVYDIDLQDAMPSRQRVRVAGLGTATWPRGVNSHAIAGLHEAGKAVICYLDSGAYESYRPDARLFLAGVIGNSTGWSGERWLDLRRGSRSRFAAIIWSRLRLAERIGCDGVEPDENNPWGNHPGFPITKDDERSWYLDVARHAHRFGLSVGMKNGLEVVGRRTVHAFDWALNEECFYFRECARMRGFVNAGKAVFQTEYLADWRHRDADSAAAVGGLICRRSLQDGFSSLVKDRVPDRGFHPC
jgi:hypothetical protein